VVKGTGPVEAIMGGDRGGMESVKAIHCCSTSSELVGLDSGIGGIF
jgi:hypothetical protein